jgi:hypothetical protein
MSKFFCLSLQRVNFSVGYLDTGERSEVRLLAYCVRGRGLEPRTIQTSVSMNMTVFVLVVSMYDMFECTFSCF